MPFLVTDALAVDINQNITAPWQPVRQRCCLAVQFHNTTIDWEHI